MQLTGKVIIVYDFETGQSKASGKEWVKQTVIIETAGQYPKKVAVSLWGEKVGTLVEGRTVTANIEIESREYNGRWYTDVKVWKIEGLSNVVNEPEPEPNLNNVDDDGLPF